MADTDIKVYMARMDERLKHLEDQAKKPDPLPPIKEKATSYKQLEKKIEQLEERLKELESKPVKRFDTLIAAIISPAISFIGALLSRFIP